MGTRAADLITDSVRAELSDALERNGAQLGLAFVAYQSGIDTPVGLYEQGVGANSGASGNLLVQVRAIIEGVVPQAPSRAVQSLRAARSLLRQNRTLLSADTLAYLQTLIAELDDASSDRAAIAAEDRELRKTTDELEQLSEHTGGVYVYTLPHYWRYPIDDQGRHLLKVGATRGDAETRIREQARATAVPQEPVILRFYLAPADTAPLDIERKFHDLLDAAGHPRSRSSSAGREWFATTVEFLDAIASLLDLQVAGE
jgi:hypothetical protein